jgi:hypothetical protein
MPGEDPQNEPHDIDEQLVEDPKHEPEQGEQHKFALDQLETAGYVPHLQCHCG